MRDVTVRSSIAYKLPVAFIAAWSSTYPAHSFAMHWAPDSKARAASMTSPYKACIRHRKHLGSWRSCAAAGLAIVTHCVGSALAYKCEGAGCCDAHCPRGEDCRQIASGALVPRWWPHNSCGAMIAAHYDATIPCSQALQPFEACGLDVPHACGYGLACVAESITYAHCAPICSWSFKDEFLHLEAVAAGCQHDPNDGQRGIMNHDVAGEYIPVGKVVWVTDSIVEPACVSLRNLAHLHKDTAAPRGGPDAAMRSQGTRGGASKGAGGVLGTARRLLDPRAAVEDDEAGQRPGPLAAPEAASPQGASRMNAYSRTARGDLAAQVVALNLQFNEVRSWTAITLACSKRHHTCAVARRRLTDKNALWQLSMSSARRQLLVARLRAVMCRRSVRGSSHRME